MKKIISIICSLALIFCVLPLNIFAEDALKIMVTADTHFQCYEDLGEKSDQYSENMLNKDMYDYCSSQGQMNYESKAILQKMLDDFESSDEKILLIAGDLTGGKKQSHLDFAQMLEDTETKTGKSIFVINGNHDCDMDNSEGSITIDEFKSIYADFGYRDAVSVHQKSGSYCAILDENTILLAVDSCIYGEDDGQINDDTFAWIQTQIEWAKAQNKQVAVMMHHSILPHYELQPMIDDYKTFAEYFAQNGISLVFTGHIHANDISKTVYNNKVLYDVQTGSLISSPNAYRSVAISGNKIEITSKYITEIDISLLPDVFSKDQLSMLQYNFSDYAYNYFEAGICKWLNRNIGSTNRLVRWFKLEEGSGAYNIAKTVTDYLGDLVGTDIYSDGDNDSLQGVLELFGDTIPESEYIKPYQVCAKLMYGFFHGDESTILNESDIDVLFSCIKGAVAKGMLNCSKVEITGVLKNLGLTNISSSIDKNGLISKASDKIAKSVLYTLANGISEDYSEPQDINVTLDLTDRSSENSVILNIAMRIMNILKEFFERIIAK